MVDVYMYGFCFIIKAIWAAGYAEFVFLQVQLRLLLLWGIIVGLSIQIKQKYQKWIVH
jgi:hypothetical protein